MKHSTIARCWCLCLAFLTVPIVVPNVVAQTPVIAPTKTQFDSPDHTKTCPSDGCVASYKIELWLQGVDPTTGQPVTTYTLAKNKVTATGLAAPEPAYQALFADVQPLWAVPAGQTYVIRMVAVGDPATLVSARSTPSGPFASCSFTLSSTSGSVVAAGGTATVTVTANGSTCGWTATSAAPWATLSATSGTGTTTLTITAAANTGTARTASLTLAGLTYTLSQTGAPVAPRTVTNIIIK
jgi:hypothetical protein